MGAGSVEALVGFSGLVLGTGTGILECLDWLLTTRAFEGTRTQQNTVFRGSRCG